MLGIDVGTSSIKLVELGRRRSGDWVLQHCAWQPLEPGWIVDGQLVCFDEVAQALRSAVIASGSQTRQVALALPPSAVISRTLVLPTGLSDQERWVQLEAEAARHIPFPMEEVSLDMCDIGPSAHLAAHVDVLMVAARRDAVTDRQGLAEAAGLQAVVIEVATGAARLAAQRVLGIRGQADAPSLVALFDVSAHTLCLQVLNQDQVLYERQQALGGGQLPEEMARSLQYFFTSTTHRQVGQIVLAGGGCARPGLSAAVTHHTGVGCSTIDPMEGMDRGANIGQNPGLHAPAYLTATGLALRRFYR